MAVGILASVLSAGVPGQAPLAAEGPTLCLRAPDLLALAERCGSAAAVEESLGLVREFGFPGPKEGHREILAFEENKFFLYAVGEASAGGEQEAPVMLRRFLLLKPSTFVVEDQLASPGAEKPRRVLHTIRLGGVENQGSVVQSESLEEDGMLRLNVSTPDRTFQLSLSTGPAGADRIEVADADGEVVLARRLLPAGVLPHGPEGTKLLERWDSRYRGDSPPGWDTGRSSSNLQKAVEDGALKPGRAVVLGCGTGTNAIYLARQGFDVTGIDIAPTALNLCRKKADEAGVTVQWLLADVVALPELDSFEFIFDRGCYHGVRRQNASGYVESVKRLSHPGTRVLVLAGNANEERHYGPPRVKKEEIRGDFSESFDFQWLKETQFDTGEEGGKGALAWSILLKRKAE
jgi:SAM-dependent methyltransferase